MKKCSMCKLMGSVLVGAGLGALPLTAATLDTTPFEANATLKVAGYSGSAALADFPVLVRLREGFPSGFAYADAGTDGVGIRFADADGNLLPHEIDTWDTTGESTVWVKLPSLSQGAQLRVYWKAGEATLPAVTASDVWTKYVAVLHGGDYTNASASGLACSAGGTTAGSTTSRIGGAAYNIAQNTKGILIGNPISNNKTTVNDGITISGWFRPTKIDASNYNVVLAASENTWNTGGFLALWERSYYFSVAIGGTHQGQSVGTSARVVALNSWEHVAFSYAGTRLNIYEDGNVAYSNAAAKQFIDGGLGDWVVGSYCSQTADSFIGQMDEIRFYRGEASADWIKAEYDAATDPNFLENVELVPNGAFASTAYLQAVGYVGTSTLIDFPVAVRIRAGFPNGFAYADVADPATDIRFFDMDGNLLPHEVDTWNTDGESLVWVRLSTLPTGGSLFKMGWNLNANVTLPANVPGKVWTKYVAVMHGSDFSNSADSGLQGAAGGGSAGSETSKLGNAAFETRQNTMGFLIDNPIKNNLMTIDSGVTFSGWFRPTKTDASSGNVVIAASHVSWNKGGFHALWERGPYISVAVSATHQGANDGTSAIRKDVWQHVAFSYAGTCMAIYDDGAQVYSNNAAKHFLDPALDVWYIGSCQTQIADSFIGQIDEVRLYNGVASADWVKAEYDSATVANFVAEVDSSTIVRAVWTNNGARGVVTDPLNWTCYNSFGDVVANALPTVESTAAHVAGETSFSLAAGGTPNWMSLTFENVVLTNACDWSGIGAEYTLSGPLDLNGFDLRVAAFPTSGTVTDTQGGSKFILDVAEGQVVGSTAAVLTGALKFVKDGAGTFRPGAVNQTYTGGTEIRAGVAESNGTQNAAPYGPAMSTIKVYDGATFDWKAARGTAYVMDIAGTGTDGQGALYNSVLETTSNFFQDNRIAGITLSDDAKFNCSGGLCGPMYVASNTALHDIVLNDHTLTLYSSGTVWQYRFFLRGIKTVGTGTIRVEGCGAVFYGPASDLTSSTFEVISGQCLSFEVSPTTGIFIDHRSTVENDSNQHAKVFVTTKLVPYTTVPTENFELGTETVKSVTLDLSNLSAPFNTTLASPARALTFAEGSTITVDPGTRLPESGAGALQLVAWSAVPEGVEFVIPKELAKRGYRLDARATGLFLSNDSMIIIVR